MLCTHLDLVAGDLVALDASTCKAVNATARTFTPAKLTQLLQIAQRIEGSLQDLDDQESQNDAGTPGGAVADQVPAKLAALQQRQLL
jgi:hypothetical protein